MSTWLLWWIQKPIYTVSDNLKTQDIKRSDDIKHTVYKKSRFFFNLKVPRDKVVYHIALCVNDMTKITNIDSGAIVFITRFLIIVTV